MTRTRKEEAVARMAWIITRMADPADGDRDLFGFLGHTVGVSAGDTRSLSLAREFSNEFCKPETPFSPKNTAAAMRNVMDKLEAARIVVSATRPLNDAKGWQKTWKMTPAAIFRIENGVSPTELCRNGVPDGAFADNGAMFSPKSGPVPVTDVKVSEGAEMNLYKFSKVVDGEEVETFWRGGLNCEEALGLIRAEGHDPIFVESLKGGAPGYWCADEAEKGISQIPMHI